MTLPTIRIAFAERITNFTVHVCQLAVSQSSGDRRTIASHASMRNYQGCSPKLLRELYSTNANSVDVQI